MNSQCNNATPKEHPTNLPTKPLDFLQENEGTNARAEAQKGCPGVGGEWLVAGEVVGGGDLGLVVVETQ
jgi:hypothetical protein